MNAQPRRKYIRKIEIKKPGPLEKIAINAQFTDTMQTEMDAYRSFVLWGVRNSEIKNLKTMLQYILYRSAMYFDSLKYQPSYKFLRHVFHIKDHSDDNLLIDNMFKSFNMSMLTEVLTTAPISDVYGYDYPTVLNEYLMMMKRFLGSLPQNTNDELAIIRNAEKEWELFSCAF